MDFEVSGAHPLLCSLVSALVAARFPEAKVRLVPGETAGARVTNTSSGGSVVFLTQPSPAEILDAVSSGASVVSLASTAAEVELALSAASGGTPYVAPGLASLVGMGGAAGDGMAQLTPREQDILTLVRAGLSNREIAETLSISIHTARTHLQSLSEKLGVRGRGRLAAAAEELPRTAGRSRASATQR